MLRLGAQSKTLNSLREFLDPKQPGQVTSVELQGRNPCPATRKKLNCIFVVLHFRRPISKRVFTIPNERFAFKATKREHSKKRMTCALKSV